MLLHTILSDDKVYRYVLHRDLREEQEALLRARPCMFLMLNPSTADESLDDPTVRKCKGYARRWGFTDLLIGNLFAFRATDPKDLLMHKDRADGPENVAWVAKMLAASEIVVCGWGQTPRRSSTPSTRSTPRRPWRTTSSTSTPSWRV